MSRPLALALVLAASVAVGFVTRNVAERGAPGTVASDGSAHELRLLRSQVAAMQHKLRSLERREASRTAAAAPAPTRHDDEAARADDVVVLDADESDPTVEAEVMADAVAQDDAVEAQFAQALQRAAPAPALQQQMSQRIAAAIVGLPVSLEATLCTAAACKTEVTFRSAADGKIASQRLLSSLCDGPCLFRHIPGENRAVLYLTNSAEVDTL